MACRKAIGSRDLTKTRWWLAASRGAVTIDRYSFRASRHRNRLIGQPVPSVVVPAYDCQLGARTRRYPSPVPHLATNLIAVAGLVSATTLAVLDKVPLLQDVLIGAGAGALLGRFLVYRLERSRGEVDPARVRQIEWTWTAIGIAAALALNAFLGLT